MDGELDRPEDMLELIGHVYDAAQNDALWVDVATRIARAFDSAGTVMLRIADGRPQFIARSANVDDVCAREYEAHYLRLAQPRGDGLQPIHEQAPCSDAVFAQSVSEPVEFSCEHPGYPGGLRGIGSIVSVATDERALVGIHRPLHAPSYGAADKRRFSALLPHLQRALRFRQRLTRSAIVARAALDRLDRSITATLVVSPDCRVLHANRAAQALLRDGDGIRVVGRRLVTDYPGLTGGLARLIAAAFDGAAAGDLTAGGTMSVPRDQRLPLTVLVAPLRPADQAWLAGSPAVIVLVRDSEIGSLAIGPLQSLFGLTSAEAVIASALAAGRSLDEIAAGLGVSPHTARAHLKRIFNKTGTSRQAQLVALLLCSVAGIASRAITQMGDAAVLPGI